jgi:arylsulfatase A-like enzyme
LDFVDASLGKMTDELSKQNLLGSTAIIISAKHGQSPMDQSSLNRIKDSKIIDDLNSAWKTQHPQATQPLVAQGTDDDGMLLWLNDRSQSAADFAKNFLQTYDNNNASIDMKPVTSAGLQAIHAGADAASFIGAPESDPRVPDVIGIAQHGVVYTGHMGKIAEHGGDDFQDRNVPILVVAPGGPKGKTNSSLVETTQIAPTILSLLGLDPKQLQAVSAEGTQVLPSGS